MKSYINKILGGRAPRGALCLFFLLNLVIIIALLAVASAADLSPSAGAALFIVYFIIALFWGLSLAVRRLHDTGKSGWWVAIILVPVAGIAWLWILLLRNGIFPAADAGKKKQSHAGQIFAGVCSLVFCAAFVFVAIMVARVVIMPALALPKWSWIEDREYLRGSYENMAALQNSLNGFDGLDNADAIGGRGWKLEPPLALLVTNDGQSRFIKYDKLPCADNLKSARTLVHVENYTFNYRNHDGKWETSEPRLKCTYYNMDKQAKNRFIEEINPDIEATTDTQKLNSLLDGLSGRLEFTDAGTFSDVYAKLDAIGYKSNYDKLRSILANVNNPVAAAQTASATRALPLSYKSANCIVVNLNVELSSTQPPDFSQYKSPDFAISVFPGGEKQTNDKILIFTRMISTSRRGGYENTNVSGYATNHEVLVINLETGELIARATRSVEPATEIIGGTGGREKDVVPLATGGRTIDWVLRPENIFKHSR